MIIALRPTIDVALPVKQMLDGRRVRGAEDEKK